MGKQFYYFLFSTLIVLALCTTQIMGNTLLILACLALFLVLIGLGCIGNFTLPILLFFLPWSPILRTSPDNFSFFTFALVLVCFISVIKKKFRFKRYHVVTAIVLTGLSLFSKLLDGNGLSFNYFAFMMLILLFPVVKEEWKGQEYDFFHIVTFLSAGIIIAALCAMNFAVYPNIAQFIKVDAYLTIIRRCGFYGDANFYTAQITAAMAGCFALILKEPKKSRVFLLALLLVFLIYCGFLSGSKSFVLIALCILAVWLISFVKMRGRVALKVLLMIGLLLLIIYIVTSAVFSELINVLVTRFSYSNDLDSFTTGRTELWDNYMKQLLSSTKTFFLGMGYTNVKINDRGSHSTLIQSLYQFGLLGVPLIIFWMICFFRDTENPDKTKRKFTLNVLMLLIGTFLPWFAIDILFFDEFFLLQWYIFIALQQPELRGINTLEDTYGQESKE